MSYIVKNCPACIISPSCCAKYHIDNGHAKDCQDITGCIIKQVIEKCKEYDKEQAEWCEPIPFCTDNIYDLFDIEEINK